MAAADAGPGPLAATGWADVGDVGCGAGHALELARGRAAERGLGNLRFERRDATRLGLEQALDVALAFDTVHDLPDPRAALAGIRRALRRGGVLVMILAAAGFAEVVPYDSPAGLTVYAAWALPAGSGDG